MPRRSGYWCNGDIQQLSQGASRFAIIPASVFPRNAGSNCYEMGFALGARTLCPPKGHPQQYEPVADPGHGGVRSRSNCSAQETLLSGIAWVVSGSAYRRTLGAGGNCSTKTI